MSQATEIVRETHQSGGRYLYGEPGPNGAEMTYSRAGQALIIIDHTEVGDGLRGSGIGLRLVEAAVADARREDFAILPLCPFAAAQFRRHREEWSDVLFNSAKG